MSQVIDHPGGQGSKSFSPPMRANMNDPELKSRFFRCLNDGKKVSEIAEELGIAVNTVKLWKLRLETCGELTHKPKTGRPKKLSDREIRSLRRDIVNNPSMSLIKRAGTLPLDVSAKTLWRYIKELGFASFPKLVGQYLTERHAVARVNWCRSRETLTQADFCFWAFSDECTIYLDDPCNRGRLWITKDQRRDPKFVKKRRQGNGGKVMIWGAMTRHGVGPIVMVEGNLNAEGYARIVRETIVPYLLGLMDAHGRPFVFVEDNAPVHNAGIVNAVFEQSGALRIDWPACSPDLNPIEHLWAWLKRELYGLPTPPRTIEDLKTKVTELWSRIPRELCQNLSLSMPNRMTKCLAANGWYFE